MTFPVIFMRTTTQPEWDEALCPPEVSGMDPDLWFLDDRRDEAESALAVAICNECPIQADCLSYALEAGIDYGIFGGVRARHRHKMGGSDPLRETRQVVATVEKLVATGTDFRTACTEVGITERQGYRLRKVLREAGRS